MSWYRLSSGRRSLPVSLISVNKYDMNRRSKALLLDAKAIAIGVVTAVLSVASYNYLAGLGAGCGAANCMVPLSSQVGLAAMFSAIYSLILAVFLAPLWYLIRLAKLDDLRSAIAVGFCSVLIVWLALNWRGYDDIVSLIVSGFPYAICGAAAAVAAWVFSAHAKHNVGVVAS